MFTQYISGAFILVISAYFLVSLVGVARDSQHPVVKSMAANAPYALTSLGILGTFFGIFIGLLEFDIQRIDDSLFKLLGGLKIAFMSSIFGLAAALLFRVLQPALAEDEAAEEDDVERLIAEIARMRKENKTGLEAILKALSAEGDSSVAGQIQRLRANINDLTLSNKEGFEKLGKEFADFATLMSETISKAIFDELKSVIHEFNEKITEQFGENFKQLNSAVGELVAWLDTYRRQMDSLREDFEEARKATIGVAEALAAMPENLAQLNAVMDTLQGQLADLDERLKAFNGVKEQALASFSAISGKIENMVEETGSATTMLVKSFDDSRETQKQMLDGMQDSVNQLVTAAKESLQRAFNQLRQSTQEQLRTILEELGGQFLGISQEFVSQVKRATEGGSRR